MKKSSKEATFSFRKMKFGLASVAVLTSFLVTTNTLAETPVTTEESPSTQSTEIAPMTSVTSSEVQEPTTAESPIAEATKDIEAASKQPVVEEGKAQAGDIIAVESNISEVTSEAHQEGNKTITYETSTAQVKTTSIAEKNASVGKQEAVIAEKETSYVTETAEATTTVNEKVVKTVNVEVVKEQDIVKTEENSTNADVVFIIDHSGSMSNEIAAVKNNITDFVNGLGQQSVRTRLGLIDYEDSEHVNYADFNGSKFTTDPAAFIKAIDNIRLDGGTEEPTVPLTYITTDRYDWSTEAGTRRFAVLITDEGIDLHTAAAPSIESTINALKSKNISVTVIEDMYYKDEFSKMIAETNGLAVDIESDFAKTLSNDISNWVVKTVYEGKLLKVVTEDYQFYVTTTVETKKAPEMIYSAVNKPTTPKPAVYKADSVKKASVKATALPETGSKSNDYLSVYGLVSLAIVSALAFYKKKED